MGAGSPRLIGVNTRLADPCLLCTRAQPAREADMQPNSSPTDRHSLIGRALDWWQGVRDNWQALLERRLASLHLNPEEIRKISPLLLADLQRTCAHCSDKKRCLHDFKVSANPEGWESYCPNAGTLKTLT